MATYYIDPILGNDSNPGTSTGAAWKTITAGPIAAKVAPGDLIKIKKSPEYTVASTTWTNNSATVTLPSNTTLSIETGEGNTWTLATNVTGGSNATRKYGTGAQSLTIASGFTTGKIAHKATGTLNLSAYTKVSFWIRSSVAIAANSLTLRLCSDTSGDTPVHTISIPPLPTNTFYPIVWDNINPLSSSIQSVSLSTSSDPGVPVILIQNIFATNGISLCTTIGPTSSTAFYPILSIVNTTCLLDVHDTTTAATGVWRDGTTGTYTTTCIEGWVADVINGNNVDNFQLNESGTSALATTLSGGWDFGSDTRTGYTSYIRYQGQTAALFNVVYENFILAKLRSAITPTATGYVTYKNIVITSSSTNPIFSLSDVGKNGIYENLQFYACTAPFAVSASNSSRVLKSCKFVNMSAAAIQSSNASSLQFNNCTFINGPIIGNNPSFPLVFKSCTFENATLPGWSNANNEVNLSFENCTGSSLPVTSTRIILGHQFRAYWQTTTKQGSDPGAWRFDSFSTSREIGTPHLFKIGEILCSAANTAVTVTAWMKKDNSTGIGISLGVLGGELAGVNETFTTKANNTSWEQVSVTFTPTQIGVIPIYARMWHAGNSSNVYIGSLTIT